MMGKVSVNELATKLIDSKGLSKKQAASFVNDMFDIIQKGLETDKAVKVKGFGTFKIISVDDRESINVNTGERVLIGGHSKITFTPDSVMKELVNKPFSQFETVVLKDGVSFDDDPDNSDSVDNDIASAPLVDFVTEPEPSKMEPVILHDQPVVEEAKPAPTLLKGELPDSDNSETPDNAEYSDNSEVTDNPEDAPVEEYQNDDDTSGGWKKWIIPVLFLIIGFAAGFLVADALHKQEAIPEELLREDVTSPEPQQQPVAVDSVKQVEETTVQDSVKSQPEVVEESVAEAKPEVKPELKPEPKPEPKKEVKPEEKTSATPVPMDKYEKMDSRVLHGAYRIVGTDHVEIIKATDNLARICKRTIGPGMECYLEVYNGIKGDAGLKPGKEIKIPKLELKKKKQINKK